MMHVLFGGGRGGGFKVQLYGLAQISEWISTTPHLTHACANARLPWMVALLAQEMLPSFCQLMQMRTSSKVNNWS